MTEGRSLEGTSVAEIFPPGPESLARIEAAAVSVLWNVGSAIAGCANADQADPTSLALDAHQRRGLRDGGQRRAPPLLKMRSPV